MQHANLNCLPENYQMKYYLYRTRLVSPPWSRSMRVLTSSAHRRHPHLAATFVRRGGPQGSHCRLRARKDVRNDATSAYR